jgi:hypothetical protein
MSKRIEMMLQTAKYVAEYGEQSSMNRHLLGMISVLAEEIDSNAQALATLTARFLAPPPVKGHAECPTCGHAEHAGQSCGAFLERSPGAIAGGAPLQCCPCTSPQPPMTIDTARAVALADAVRVFLQHWTDPSKLGRCTSDCAEGLAEALEKFESGK